MGQEVNTKANEFNEQISPEQEIILQLIRYRYPNKERIRELLKLKLDWTEILGYLFYHRVAGIAYNVLIQSETNINSEVDFVLYLNHEIQSLRTMHQQTIIRELSQELNHNSIPHAFLKGAVLTNMIYLPGNRVSKDIDLLIGPKYLTEMGKILVKLGYVQGTFNKNIGNIKVASRSEILTQRLNYGEIVPYVKISDHPGYKFISIDLNFSLGWTAQNTSNIYNFLNSTEPYYLPSGDMFVSLSKEYMLAHLCVHLFKEACVSTWVIGVRDMTLYKYVDIYSFIIAYHDQINWSLLLEIININKIKRECYYTLFHTIILFPNICGINGLISFIDEIKPEDITYLDEVQDAGNPEKRYRWKKGLLTRLFDFKRSNNLEEIM